MGLLSGQVAFITGAARGQGRSHALRLAEEGADIIAVDIDHDIDSVYVPMARAADLAQTVKLVQATDHRIVARTADVRDQVALDAVVAEGLAEFGHIDIVSANAGVSTKGKTWELSDAEWQDVIDINLTGVWRTVKAVVPSMIEADRGGCIVLTSSLAGLKGYSNIAAYVAAKHGVNGLMRTLANELGPHRIRVNSVCPGLIDTDLMMNGATYALFRPEIEHPTKQDAIRTMQVLPTDYLDPVDVSNTIVFLASNAARYVTGWPCPSTPGRSVGTDRSRSRAAPGTVAATARAPRQRGRRRRQRDDPRWRSQPPSAATRTAPAGTEVVLLADTGRQRNLVQHQTGGLGSQVQVPLARHGWLRTPGQRAPCGLAMLVGSSSAPSGVAAESAPVSSGAGLPARGAAAPAQGRAGLVVEGAVETAAYLR